MSLCKCVVVKANHIYGMVIYGAHKTGHLLSFPFQGSEPHVCLGDRHSLGADKECFNTSSLSGCTTRVQGVAVSDRTYASTYV